MISKEEAKVMVKNFQRQGSLYELAQYLWDWQEYCPFLNNTPTRKLQTIVALFTQLILVAYHQTNCPKRSSGNEMEMANKEG